MLRSFKIYLATFLHPIEGAHSEEKMTSIEVLGISWSMHLLSAFYSIFAIYLGTVGYEFLSSSENYAHLVFNTFDLSFEKLNILWIIASAIFYPLLFWFGYRIWIFFLKFYALIFEYTPPEGVDTEDVAEDILNTTLSANLLLAIPIFGSFLSFIAKAYYLFVNLRKKFFFTKMQSFLVLITPFFLLFLIVLLMALYVSFLFSIF